MYSRGSPSEPWSASLTSLVRKSVASTVLVTLPHRPRSQSCLVSLSSEFRSQDVAPGAVGQVYDAVERSGGVVGGNKEADHLQGGEELGVGGIAFVPLAGIRVLEIGVVAYEDTIKRAGCSRYIQDHLELKAASPDHDAAQRHGEVGPTRAVHWE